MLGHLTVTEVDLPKSYPRSDTETSHNQAGHLSSQPLWSVHSLSYNNRGSVILNKPGIMDVHQCQFDS